MQTLEEFNQERRRHYQPIVETRPNGIACPNCGEELWDSNPNMMLTSNPPQQVVRCPLCGYKGYRIA